MRSLFEKIKLFIKDRSKQLRWIVGGVLGIVAGITLFLFAIINTSSVRGTLINNATTSTEQSVHLSYLHLKNYHDEITQRGSKIADELHSVRMDEEAVLNKMTDIYHLNVDIISISLFNQNGVLDSYAPAFLREESTNLFQQEWFDEAPENLQILLSAPHLQSNFIMQPTWVVSLTKSVEVAGEQHYLVVDFDFSQVGDYFNRIEIGERGYAYIANRAGEILYHPKRAQFSKSESDAIDSVLSFGDGTYVTENEEYSIGHRTVSHTGWKVVGISYLDDTVIPAMEEIQELTYYTLIVMFGLIIGMSLLLSKYISEPITQMIKQISRAEIGDSEERVYQDRFNEVRQLSESYNRQMDRINQLMEQIKQEQSELRKSEMNVLQAQINPHFLYNTLDSILWLAESGETKETSEMVAALGRLLRISLSQGENLIPLRKELEHAENYLTIQKFRYKDQFTYSIEAEEHLLDYLTVKIIIQPFLENALYHGIEYMVDQGHLSIRVYEIMNLICIEIKDDGVGMDVEKLAYIQMLKESIETGIGIRNVHQRVQVYFGKEYGVDIHSELDEGTTVQILIPKALDQSEIMN